MFRSSILLLVNLIILQRASSENLSGIYVIDSCECNSPTENCESNGPFIFDQQRSTLAIRYGTIQVGVGALENNQLDIYFNQNRCKGLWNGKNRVAELSCQRQSGTVCLTKFRCASGSCHEAKSFRFTSTAININISLVSIISSLLIVLLY